MHEINKLISHLGSCRIGFWLTMLQSTQFFPTFYTLCDIIECFNEGLEGEPEQMDPGPDVMAISSRHGYSCKRLRAKCEQESHTLHGNNATGLERKALHVAIRRRQMRRMLRKRLGAECPRVTG